MGKRLTVITMAVFAAAVSVTVALATPAVGTLAATVFARGALTTPVRADADGVKLRAGQNTDHVVQTITFGPNSSSGWHRHPGVVLVTVQSGTAVHYESDCKAETIAAGQTFWESGAHATVLRNETNHDMVVYVTYILPTAAPLRVDMPNPGCSVD